MQFEVREIEKLEIRVLLDNSGGTGYGLLGTHGLSMLIRTQYESQCSNVLFDVGPNADVLLNNMERLGVSPSGIDCIVLSHSHYDHAGALVKVVEAIGKRPLAIVTHPDAFRVTYGLRPSVKVIGTLCSDRAAVEAQGGVFVSVSEPMEVAPGLFTTGTVPRSTGEPTGVKTFCVRDDGSCTEDPIFDDISLVAKVGDCGLSVITGCSHSGIVNILRHCTQLAGCNDLELVIGGFHLLGATDDRMSWTMSEFAAMKPSRVVSGHCTGFDAEARFRQQMGSAYESMFTGKAIRVPR